jgi:hypothetical protein
VRFADESRSQAEQANYQPAARDGGEQRGGGFIHRFRRLEVRLQRFVFALMPAVRGKLRQARAMPHHALHQVVRHGQAHVGPIAVAPVISPGRDRGNEQPAGQQSGLEDSARARGQHEDRDDQLDESDESEKTAAERQRFHGFGFEHTP